MTAPWRNVLRETILIPLVVVTASGFAHAEVKAGVTSEQQEDAPSGTIWVLRERELSPVSSSGQPLGPPIVLPAEYTYGSFHGAANGRHLVVSGGRGRFAGLDGSSAQLFVIDTVARTVRPITPELEPGCLPGPRLRCELAYGSPALSWDGEWIVARKFWRWVPCDGPGPTFWYPAAEAVVLRSDGSGESTLFTIVPADEAIQRGCAQNGFSFGHPRFSPDGRHVVAGLMHADSANLVVIEMATGERQWLNVAHALGADSGGCSDGSFTPDGLIVCSYGVINMFTPGVERRWGLALFRADGNLVRVVPGTPNRSPDEMLHLAAAPVSPDGEWLLAHVEVTGPLVRVRLADGAMVPIADNVEAAVWVGAPVRVVAAPILPSHAGDVHWPVTVTGVIDGDTVCVEWPGPPPSDPGQTPNRKECEDHNLPGWPVRLGGIDTPELTDCYGGEARSALRRLLAGKDVWVELDPAENLDPGGRILGYLWAGGEFVNHRLVVDGFAMEAHWFGTLIGLPGYHDGYVNTTKYESQLVEAQRWAQQADRGLWGACPLLREKGQLEVYWVQHSIRHHVAEPVLHLQEHAGVPQWSWAWIVNVPPGALDAYPLGPALVNSDSSSDGLLLRRWTREAGPTDVFLMDGGRDRHIKNPTAFEQYGFSWDDVIDVSPPVLDIPADGPTIYAIGQVSVDREDLQQEFLGGYQALDVGNRPGLGYAIDWIRDEDSPSPVSARGGSSQRFDNGGLELREGDSRAFAVYGGIWLCWRGVECRLEPEPDVGSWLGWPLSNENDWMEGRRQDFEGGYIFWTAARGATPHPYADGPGGVEPVIIEPTPDPQPPPGARRGQIAFVGTDGDLWTVHPDGTGRVRLTQGGGTGRPAWSPDGSTIAYIRGDSRLHLVNAEGSGTTEVRLAGTCGRHVAWLEERRLSWSINRVRWSGDGHGLFVNLNWGGPAAKGVCFSPLLGQPGPDFDALSGAWDFDVRRPDGAFVYVRGGQGCFGFVLAGSDGRGDRGIGPSMGAGCMFEPSALPVDPSAPIWSPDGQMIAFYGGGRVIAIAADGSNLRDLVSRGASGSSLAFSPDGSFVAFEGEGWIWLLHLQTGRGERLAQGSGPAWSP